MYHLSSFSSPSAHQSNDQSKQTKQNEHFGQTESMSEKKKKKNPDCDEQKRWLDKMKDEGGMVPGVQLRSENRCHVICTSTQERCRNRAISISSGVFQRFGMSLAAVISLSNLRVDRADCCRLCSTHYNLVMRKFKQTQQKLAISVLSGVLAATTEPSEYGNYQELKQTSENLGELADRPGSSVFQAAGVITGLSNYSEELENMTKNFQGLLSKKKK